MHDMHMMTYMLFVVMLLLRTPVKCVVRMCVCAGQTVTGGITGLPQFNIEFKAEKRPTPKL